MTRKPGLHSYFRWTVADIGKMTRLLSLAPHAQKLMKTRWGRIAFQPDTDLHNQRRADRLLVASLPSLLFQQFNGLPSIPAQAKDGSTNKPIEHKDDECCLGHLMRPVRG